MCACDTYYHQPVDFKNAKSLKRPSRYLTWSVQPNAADWRPSPRLPTFGPVQLTFIERYHRMRMTTGMQESTLSSNEDDNGDEGKVSALFLVSLPAVSSPAILYRPIYQKSQDGLSSRRQSFPESLYTYIYIYICMSVFMCIYE